MKTVKHFIFRHWVWAVPAIAAVISFTIGVAVGLCF